MIIFFFSDPATTEISTLPLPAALPIWGARLRVGRGTGRRPTRREATSSAPSSRCGTPAPGHPTSRSQQAAPEAACAVAAGHLDDPGAQRPLACPDTP